MRVLILQIISGTLGLWIAIRFVPGVELTEEIKYLFFAGLILGLLNSFLKPVLKFITLPVRLLTFGLFGLVINMALIWTVDLIFLELTIVGIMPLLWTTFIIWGLSFFVFFLFPKTRSSACRPPSL